MTKDHDPVRRQVLQLLLSAPVALAIGCDKPAPQAQLLSPEASLKKLILVLGPWPAEDKKNAEDFANRFLKSEHAVSPFLPESGELIQKIAARFSAGTMALKEVDLGAVTAKERELLLRLAGQLYSFLEVRFLISNEPPFGACQADKKRYTRPPAG